MSLPYALKAYVDAAEKHGRTEVDVVGTANFVLDYFDQKRKIRGFHRIVDYMESRGWKLNADGTIFRKAKTWK